MTDFSERNRLAANKLKRVAHIGALASLFLSISSAALAAGTPASTKVSNSFVLDYTAGGAAQSTVTNMDSQLEFTVDRVIDLTVSSLGNQTVAPGTHNQDVMFSLQNMGNDTQAYSLRVANDQGDDFDVSNVEIKICFDDGDGVFEPGADDGEFQTYNGRSLSGDIAADTILWVSIHSTIPTNSNVTKGAQSSVTLIAETLEPSTADNPGTPVFQQGQETSEMRTFLADQSGSSHEGPKQGNHSASTYYMVDSPELSAENEFNVHNQSGTDCGTLSSPRMEGLAIPGACVEYKFTIENTGETLVAEDITFVNTLDETLKFALADMSGFTGGALEQPVFEKDCALSACNVTLTDAALAPGDTGIVIIRALLK